MYQLCPSILSADFCNLEEGIRQTEENGAVYLHFDVMVRMKTTSLYRCSSSSMILSSSSLE